MKETERQEPLLRLLLTLGGQKLDASRDASRAGGRAEGTRGNKPAAPVRGGKWPLTLFYTPSVKSLLLYTHRAFFIIFPFP